MVDFFLSKTFYIPFGLLVGTYFAIWLLKNIIIDRLHKISKKTSTYVDDLVLDVLIETRQFFIIGAAIFSGFQALELDNTHGHYADKALIILIAIQSIIWGQAAIKSWIEITIKQKKNDPAVRTSMGFVGILLKILLIATVLLFALNNLGVNVSTFIAGLGVGGIAIALATQKILGDLFSSLSIVMDKPFIVGDSISFGEWQGTIEYIGLKTTRIRSINGEQIIVSNSDLLSSKIRNFKRMNTRRVAFTVGLKYGGPKEALKKVPETIRGILSKFDHVKVDRVHFRNFGNSALEYEVVYIYQTPDFVQYADDHEKILWEIGDVFESQGLEFAFPTQTVIVEKAVNS